MDMKIDLEPELAAIFEGKQTMWSVVEKESELAAILFLTIYP